MSFEFLSSSAMSSSIPNMHHHLTLKLTSENYLLWKTQLMPLLRSYNLLGYINDSLKCPPAILASTDTTPSSPTPNPEFEEWHRKDQLVLSWLISSLSTEVLPYVVGLSTAAAVWDALESSFSTLSHTSVLQLHMQLQSTSEGNKTISEYLREVKYISDQLATANKPLSDEELNAIVFRNLGGDYSDIVAALATKIEALSFHTLHRLLVSHELRLQTAQSVLCANVSIVSPKAPSINHRSPNQQPPNSFVPSAHDVN